MYFEGPEADIDFAVDEVALFPESQCNCYIPLSQDEVIETYRKDDINVQ